MKNAFTFWKIFRAIWPEVKAVIHHIQAMLPEDEHVPAARHVIAQGRKTLAPKGPDTAWTMPPHIKVSTWNRNQMKDFDLENF